MNTYFRDDETYFGYHQDDELDTMEIISPMNANPDISEEENDWTTQITFKGDIYSLAHKDYKGVLIRYKKRCKARGLGRYILKNDVPMFWNENYNSRRGEIGIPPKSSGFKVCDGKLNYRGSGGTPNLYNEDHFSEGVAY